MGREARVARKQQGLQAGLLAQSFGSCVPSLHRMGYMENCLYQISFCQWVADENMYTIVMYDRDWQNQALDGTGDIIPFHWRRPTLWEVLLVIWCERQDAVHVAVDIDNCQARNSDTPLLEIDFTGMTTVVFSVTFTVRRYKRLWLVAVLSVVCIRVSLILEEIVARLLSSSD